MKEPIVINAETREITVPETERAFGVAGERKVEVKHIRIEGRTVDGTDLTQGFSWKVSCENAGKELCADLIDGIVADAGNIEFDWIVGAAPMAYKGTMHFAVCAVRVDVAGNILQEWHSKLGTGDVANGIEATVQNIGGQDLLAHIQSITAAAQQNAAAAQRDAAAAAKSAEDAANSAAAAKDSEDAAASSATDAAKSQSAAAASERNAEASKNLAATSESNASASASAAAASETAAKASANKAQALVEGIPDDYATALKDISRLKENKLDKPNNPVVGQLLRVKSISDTGEITLETVAESDDNKLPTGGNPGQVLAKNTNSDYDVGWVNQTDALPDGGDSGQVLTKNSSTSGDASWQTPATPSNPLPTGGSTGQVLAKSTNSDYDVGWVDQTDALPDGGASGQVLTKNSSTNGDASWKTPGVALPTGGTAEQILTKNSATDGDASWKDAPIALPDGGTSGQVLAKKSDESFDAGWVDAVAGSLPKGGYPGFILQKKSVSDFDAEWVSIGGNLPSEVWKNENLSSGTFSGSIDVGTSIYVSGKHSYITSNYTLCYTDAEDISADYFQMLSGNKTMYTITVPGTSGARITDYSFKMQTARGYRYVYIDTDVSYGLTFTDGFNMQGAKDNSVAIPYAIIAEYERVDV